MPPMPTSRPCDIKCAIRALIAADTKDTKDNEPGDGYESYGVDDLGNQYFGPKRNPGPTMTDARGRCATLPCRPPEFADCMERGGQTTRSLTYANAYRTPCFTSASGRRWSKQTGGARIRTSPSG
ncbi:MAG: hypothetical protein MZV70_03345 [Desulfobacterales bacterium]|nr:hypothetical protein [Desulfobacterales bacterium]